MSRKTVSESLQNLKNFLSSDKQLVAYWDNSGWSKRKNDLKKIDKVCPTSKTLWIDGYPMIDFKEDWTDDDGNNDESMIKNAIINYVTVVRVVPVKFTA